MRDLHVLIIGAGIGGLTAALALQRSGHRVSVFEKSTTLGDVGAGITITPNGCHVLYHLLGRPLVDDICHAPLAGAIKHYRTGEILVNTQRGDRPARLYGAPYCQAHRADLHGALAAAVRANDPRAIRLDHAFVDLHETPAEIRASFANGETAGGDLLVGSDGIRSQARTVLWGEEEVRFTGYIAWRGLVPAAHVDRRHVTPPSAAFAGPGRTFTRYLVRRGTIINYVAFSRRAGWEAESWSLHADVAEVLDEFHDFAPEVRDILAATPPAACFKWGLFDRTPLARWTRGRATLLGDAAHPMTPFLAQGAVMAIEDAMILARSCDAAGDWTEALRRYEGARRERATRVMLESQANAKRMYSRDPDNYSSASHVNAESLGLYAYNPVTAAID